MRAPAAPTLAALTLEAPTPAALALAALTLAALTLEKVMTAPISSTSPNQCESATMGGGSNAAAL